MIEILAGLLILAGGAFTLIAAIGIVRLPDLLTRMHASTKAGTLGSILVLAALALVFATDLVVTKTIVTILFLLLTAPIAAHMIGRAYVRTEKRIHEGAPPPDPGPDPGPDPAPDPTADA